MSTHLAAPCLNGGYANLTSATESPAFTTEAACVLFLGQGGTPVAVASFTALGDAGCGDITFTGSGLQGGSPVYLYSADGDVVNFRVASVNPDGTLNTYIYGAFLSKGFPADTYVYSAESATGTTLYSTVHCQLRAHAVSRPRIVDLDGAIVDLAAFRGRESVFLFWNPGCGYCGQMLRDLKAREGASCSSSGPGQRGRT